MSKVATNHKRMKWIRVLHYHPKTHSRRRPGCYTIPFVFAVGNEYLVWVQTASRSNIAGYYYQVGVLTTVLHTLYSLPIRGVTPTEAGSREPVCQTP